VSRPKATTTPRGDNGQPPAIRAGRPNLADSVERAQTPGTPFRALAGVWIIVAAAVAVILALVILALYLS